MMPKKNTQISEDISVFSTRYPDIMDRFQFCDASPRQQKKLQEFILYATFLFGNLTSLCRTGNQSLFHTYRRTTHTL